MSSEDDTTMAAVAHVLGLFTWIVGPAILYYTTDDEFVKENAANALNWQIFFTIYMTVSLILVIVLIGIVLAPIVGLVDLVFCAIAALKALDGETWSYPATMDLV